ncbi:MAG: PAS domain S-box protein [Desulfobacterales bacterium]|nr:PAS domain S-box protein [Desulfobacterales bacterium]
MTPETSFTNDCDLHPAGQAADVLRNLQSAETQILSNDDRWYSVKIIPYRTGENVIAGVVMTFVDVNEVKQAGKLRRLATVLEDANDAVMVLDLRGNFLAWNQGAEHLYGWSESEALKMSIRDLVPEETQNDELGRVLGELEKARDRYSHLYDFAPVGYFTVDEKGIIQEVNLAGAAMIGAGRSGLTGKPFSRIVFRDDQDIFYIFSRKLLETEAPGFCELRLVKPDGHEFDARLEGMVVKYRDEEFRQIRAVVSDITGRKKMEEELLKAKKLESVGLLAGGLAHDFNNILTVIRGNLSLARMDLAQGDDPSALLSEAEMASMRAQDLTRSCLITANTVLAALCQNHLE